MKILKHGLILAVVIGILCISAPADVEILLPTDEMDKPSLIGRAYPELAGIETLYVDIMTYIAEPNKNISFWKEMRSKVMQKITEGGIKVANSNEGVHIMRSLFIPQLRTDIEMIRLDNSQQCVFSIQTSLSRAVRLGEQHEPSFFFKADVWKTQPVMLAASVKDMPSVVTNSILTQIEAFINAYHVANSQPVQSDDNNANSETLQQALREAPSELLAIEFGFVASKNSGIFHKSDCRWAKNISPSNQVTYRSRDEAIKDGKKPCGTCRP